MIALAYPDSPSLTDKVMYQTFFETLGHVLPCGKCCRNYQRHLAEMGDALQQALSSRSALFDWTVRLHNIVNAEHGKRLWSTMAARRHYDALVSGTHPVLDQQNNNILLYLSAASLVLIVSLISFLRG